ncbi:MAG: hypothetical protein E7442_03200 [Ruminococcaceae bacterium]|nr:hypothetical protein [Oscillospiraceae bacterium]
MSVLGFLGKLLLIGGALLLALVAVVLYFAFKKPKDAAVPASQPAVQQGNRDLTELKRMTAKVKDAEIRALGDAVAKRADLIMQELKKQPEEAKKLSQFFNYYLPTLGKILGKYAELEQSGVVAENVRENTEKCLRDLCAALEKQHTELFKNDILDLSVEMAALTMTCQRDGLISGEELKLQMREMP